MSRTEKAIASIAAGALIFGLAFGAGTHALHIVTASAIGLGVIFGTTFASKKQIQVAA